MEIELDATTTGKAKQHYSFHVAATTTIFTSTIPFILWMRRQFFIDTMLGAASENKRYQKCDRDDNVY